jgi:hypothetical protein
MIFTQGNTQVYSPSGSFVVEQHDRGCLQRHIQDLPRPDLKLGKDPHWRGDCGDERRSA